MAMYLKITDGVTTLDLLGNDATNSFNLLASGWAPNVARRKRSQLGGNWAEDVEEALPLFARSSADEATVLINIDTLAALIDQAQRWALGEAVNPVIIRYSPNSDVSYLEAVIFGPPDGDAAIELPPTFSDDLWQRTVDSVVLRFKRRGLWLDGEESDNSPTANGINVYEANFGTSLKNLSPVKIKYDGMATTLQFNDSFLIVDPTAQMEIVEAEAAASGSSGATVNDSANDARGGQIRRLTATSTTTQFLILATSLISSGLLEVFAVVRNNGGADWDLQYQSISADGNYTNLSTVVRVTADNTSPQIVPLGFVSSPLDDHDGIFVYATPSTSSGSPTLDFDYFLVTPVGIGTTIVRINKFGSSGFVNNIEIDHNYLLKPKPHVVANYEFSAKFFPGASGNAFAVTAGQNLYAAFLAARQTDWQYGSSEAHFITATRRPAYLVPQ